MATKKQEPKPHFLGDGEFNLPQLEEKVLAFWDERKIFEKSLEKNKSVADGAKGKKFVFYEGPPYANGKPAIHHVLARVVKDVILRYKTMRGYYVPRRAGWDTHGLPVEMAAEKVLGFKTKKDIEKFGVQRFNEEAKKQVWIHEDEWRQLTNRIGYWLDLDNAYVTYAPEYIETIWWILAQISKRDLLYKGHKVVPWCTRCGTALSSHELAQGYKQTVDRSVYVKFKLKREQKISAEFTTDDKTYILSWTTTPWTLPGNVALAVNPNAEYVRANLKGGEEIGIMSKDFYDRQDFTPVRQDGSGEIIPNLHPSKDLYENAKPIPIGAYLVDLEYEPLFEVAPLKSEDSYKIYPADFVTTTDGTGVVHTAVMYGEDDYELGKKIGLPQHHTVNEEGKFTKDVPVLFGEYAKAKDTEDHIFEHLRSHGNLLRIEKYDHEYPYCWRCGTAILYYARTSWFIAMSKLRKELLKNNETVHWMPEHIRDGRMGEWLREAKDWNLSRERYWGAPLPIWECAKCGHTEVVESLARLDELASGGDAGVGGVGAKAVPVAKNNYFAMRHGEAESNMLGVIDSVGTMPLTPKGKKQIEEAARGLEGKHIDLIFASDFTRTKESAEIAAKILGVKKIIFDKRLHEIYLASLSGKPLAEYWALMRREKEHFSAHVLADAESFDDVRARVWSFIKELEAEYHGKNILIVSHEDAIWMMAQAVFGWSDRVAAEKKDESQRVFLDNGEILQFQVKNIPRDDTGRVDLHRPFVDEIVLNCPKCETKMKRVREVADVWFDSGAMPYAQAHYPFAFESEDGDGGGRAKEVSPKSLSAGPIGQLDFPADYIAEGMDQLRGWFYTLLAIATALGYEAPYRNVITFGLMNDKFGNKMSKSKGNVIEPFAIIDKYGVDAVRWYFYAGTPFGEPKNFDELEIAKMFRKVHLIIYNSFVFWDTYAKKDARLKNEPGTNLLDVWILARLGELTVSITKKLDAYQIREAAIEVEGFVDDLSRWYIRRSRRRLQRPDENGTRDYEMASATLHFVLLELVKLMAPFTPFFSEILYSALDGEKESVHLEEWPTVAGGANGDVKTKTADLTEGMRMIREFAALGLAKRAEAGIKVRQPLGMLRVAKDVAEKSRIGKGVNGGNSESSALLSILADEVNVKKIFLDPILKEGVELDTAITPELREEGLLREVSRMVQELRQKAGLEPKDAIALMLELPDAIRDAITKNEVTLKSDVGAKSVEYKKSEKFSAEEATKIDGQEVWVGIRKIL